MYLDWVEQNRRRVDELSHGRIGYMHLPDMGENGIREFIKWYYPQLRKEALLIDDRANGGGNISRMVIQRLIRPMLGLTYARTIDTPGPYPDSVFIGPKAVLLDENAGSDGDIFPWMFRTAKLGPLIGERTWGGVVGITSHGQADRRRRRECARIRLCHGRRPVGGGRPRRGSGHRRRKRSEVGH